MNKDQYKLAAANLRAPYWDWAANSVPPDEVIALKNVTIVGPDGKRKSVTNPLYAYTFHPIDQSFPAPYNNWQTTFRHPRRGLHGVESNVKALKS